MLEHDAISKMALFFLISTQSGAHWDSANTSCQTQGSVYSPDEHWNLSKKNQKL